jgi:hypothetical protein
MTKSMEVDDDDQLFSKLHNYFSTKSPRNSIHFGQHCTRFWNPSLKKLFLEPFSHCRLHLTLHLTVLTSTHWS